MADPNATVCAACGAIGELHEHHLVPRAEGGAELPTVKLCITCHGLVHGRMFSTQHAELTRLGLAAARARGVKLGSPNFVKGNRWGDSRKGRDAQTQTAREKALSVLPHIEAAQKDGASLGEVARRLTAAGIPTPRGRNSWSTSQVVRAITTAARDPNEPRKRQAKATYLPRSIKIDRTN